MNGMLNLYVGTLHCYGVVRRARQTPTPPDTRPIATLNLLQPYTCSLLRRITEISFSLIL